jgi:hypothetical protein
VINVPTRLLRLAALAAVLSLALAASASAAKKPPSTTTTGTTTSKTKTTKAVAAALGPTGKTCWKALIKDWYDGRIDKTYPVHCYRDALKHLPQDVKTYSDAYDVISRALADATSHKKHPDPNALVPPPGSSGGGGGGGAGHPTTTPSIGPNNGPIPSVLGKGDRGATGIPIPLLVLGGLALLLVAAGGAGLLARRYQARRGGR